MDRKQIWTIVGVLLAAAVVVSIVTASITGNVIRLNQDKYGRYQVYTKGEIDAKLKDVATGTPKNCMAHSFNWITSENGTAVCREQSGNNCLIGEVTMTVINNSAMDLVASESKFIPCEYNFEDFDEDEKMDPNSGLSVTANFAVICCD